MSSPIQKRYDFVLVFDVKDGNPNGDPDAGNLPRIDPETGAGLVTDVCIKRKIRNFVQLTKNEAPGFDIFIKEKAILNLLIEKASEEIGVDLYKSSPDEGNEKKLKTARKGKDKEIEDARTQMCAKYFDIRAFGAVLSTGANAGQVRGPVQLTFGRSVDRIVTLEHSITRMAVASEKEAQSQSGDNRTMGRKNTVSYGLYVAHGFISPFLAKQTGFSEEDLDLLWQAMKFMFEHDRSAARGEMATRKLIVFEHADPLGNAPAHQLFDLVQIQQKDKTMLPRSFKDYELTIDKENIPNGITHREIV